MSEVKKNITVCGRVRPSLEGDDSSNTSTDILQLTHNKVTITSQTTPRTYDFDTVYDRSISNDKLYTDQVEPLVQKVIAGCNACVVAYGAGRTGKSYTLFGSGAAETSSSAHTADGLLQLSIDSIFTRLESLTSSHKFFISLSAYDVYQTQLVDLLCPNTKAGPNSSTQGLNLIDHRGLGACVEGLTELECTNASEMKLYLHQALSVHEHLELRQTHSLGKSSTFIDIKVETQENDAHGIIKYSTMRFCVPAGSGGVSLKFNQGLQALSKCVELLSNAAASAGSQQSVEPWNIPYSSSKLTRLLEPALGGNAYTVWFMNMDSTERNITDSQHVCELGEKLKKCKNVVRVNKNTIHLTMKELREERNRLRGKLGLSQPGSSFSTNDIDPTVQKNLSKICQELDRIKANTWERRHSKSVQALEQRKNAYEQEGLLYVLTSTTNLDIPLQMLSSKKTMLQAIVSQKQLVDENEQEVEEKRKVFKLRLEAVGKKAVQGGAGEQSNRNSGNSEKDEEESKEDTPAASTSNTAIPQIPDLLKSDDKLLKLQKSLLEAEDKLKVNQTDLAKMSGEFLKLLTKIKTIETRQQKVYLMDKNLSGLEKLNKQQEWSVMRREQDEDKTLQDMLTMIQQNSQAQKDALMQSGDVGQLKDAAVQTLEALKETTESSKRLEWERDALWGRLIESQFKNEVQMTRYQEHMFLMFRNYRTYHEEQKSLMETRHRELLENSIKDALKLSEENQKLRAQLDARLRQI